MTISIYLKKWALIGGLFLAVTGSVLCADESVEIRIDFSEELGPMDPIWAWWGYDEPNYTYMKDGKKLLSKLADLSPVPVFVRTHSLLVTGEGTHSLKWGSTNAYTEDEDGNPIYDWTIVDRIFDTYIERGMKPFAQIGFMPEALSSNPEPYRHDWKAGKPGEKGRSILAGWAYPPNDYNKWAELVYQWVLHSVERYGQAEVESWYWELWNEPNIVYWKGTTEEYLILYDYTADAVKRALPTAMMGGPETTGPGGTGAEKFLRTFLDHVAHGTNYVTGEIGSPLDFITFHAKGKPELVESGVRMGIGKQLRDINKGFEIVASYPEFVDLPIIIGESDPEGCAACSTADNPQNAYRNGTMYAAYTAASFARKYELAEHHGVNLLGAVTWGFEFEDQDWFAGFRVMSTNGVAKPVLNVFRMFGLMEGERVRVSGDLEYDYLRVRDESVRGLERDINAIAARGARSSTVMVWNYHDDDDLSVPSSTVELSLAGISAEKVLLNHFRIDQEFSNSYTCWLAMGSPQNPTPVQIEELESAGELQLYTSPRWVDVREGQMILEVTLPPQGVSLLQLLH